MEEVKSGRDRVGAGREGVGRVSSRCLLFAHDRHVRSEGPYQRRAHSFPLTTAVAPLVSQARTWPSTPPPTVSFLSLVQLAFHRLASSFASVLVRRPTSELVSALLRVSPLPLQPPSLQPLLDLATPVHDRAVLASKTSTSSTPPAHTRSTTTTTTLEPQPPLSSPSVSLLVRSLPNDALIHHDPSTSRTCPSRSVQSASVRLVVVDSRATTASGRSYSSADTWDEQRGLDSQPSLCRSGPVGAQKRARWAKDGVELAARAGQRARASSLGPVGSLLSRSLISNAGAIGLPKIVIRMWSSKSSCGARD